MNEKNTQINSELHNSTVNGSVVTAEQVNNSFNKTEIDHSINIDGSVNGSNIAGGDINITHIYNNPSSAYSFISLKRIFTLLKNSKSEKIAFFAILALVSLGVFLQLSDNPQLAILKNYHLYLVSYFLSAVCFIFIGYQVIKKLAVSIETENKPLPSAIKGLMPFTVEDGALFRRLEREIELAQLKNHVANPQLSLLIMMGESGAGKTSLLRAGLSNILKDSDIKYVYWEALPHDSVAGLLKTIKQSLSLDIGQLSDILTANIKAVIVLDQFEQLVPDKLEHKPIFELLKQIALATPPHTITWIIAFRREYLPYWRDFELEQKLKQLETISLKLFNLNQANNVMATLAEAAGLTLEQDLIDSFIHSVQQDNKLSPVDIGIGLLMLQELASQKQRQQLSLKDYQFAGGSQGLFVSFIKTKIEQRFIDKQEQEALFKALLELINLQRNQRIAEGKTLIELTEKAQGLDSRLLEYALEHFASSQVRLLEKISRENNTAYRLPHESMIPALRQLTNSLLGEVAQADLMLETAFIAWQNSTQRNSRYLLSGKELKQVLQFQQQLNIEGKTDFLKQSLKQRAIKRTAILLSTILLSVASYSGYQLWQNYESKRELEIIYSSILDSLGLPRDIRDYSEKITVLFVSDVVPRLDWLDKFKPLTTLNLNVNYQVTDLSVLKELTDLTTLNLDLSNSKITNLSALKELISLTTLNLDLRYSQIIGFSQITGLSELKELTNLTSLSLALNARINDLNVLMELKGLTTLSLDLNDTFITDLSVLKELKDLKTLNLDLNDQITDLNVLKELKALTTLNLDLNNQITGLSELKELKSLTSLSLSLSNTKITDLGALTELKGLTTLNLGLYRSEVIDLSALIKLKGLTTLNLVLSDTQIIGLDVLKELKELNGLTTLNLNLSDTQITDLSMLKELKELNDLTTLHLNLSNTQITDLNALKELKELKDLASLNLDLYRLQITDLNALKELKGLTSLSLGLYRSQITDLSVLKELKGLTTLNLDLSDTQITDLSALKELKGLTTLILNLSSSQITDLSVLKELTSLTMLNLDLSSSQITDLGTLKELNELKSLDLDLSNSKITELSQLKDIYAEQISLDIRNTQIKSLKGIPPNAMIKLKIGTR